MKLFGSLSIPMKKELINQLEQFAVVRRNVSMAEYTSYRTGGAAEIFVEPKKLSSVSSIMRLCSESSLPVAVIGGGTNLLVGDRGIDGVVLRLASDMDEPSYRHHGDGKVVAASYCTKESFISQSLKNNLGGVLFAAGVPGVLGGGIYMNAGTYMGSFADVLTSVDIVDPSGEEYSFAIDKGEAGYRSMGIPEGSVVLRGHFLLPRYNSVEDLRQQLKEILAERRKKHPLDFPSAGSVFKNPLGHSSWKLIDDSGLKGFSKGGARVSELHTNFIINAGGATSADILNLIEHIQLVVAENYGISLETEVRRLGNF